MGHRCPTNKKNIAFFLEKSVHVLGLKWDHNNGRVNSSTVTKSLIQRLELSLVSKVFDPSGTIYYWCPNASKGHLQCQQAALE